MNLLAIDTSSNACSVALQCGGEITEKHVVEPREHTRLLMPMITEILGDRAPQELDAIVLGNGPGSFIGMRIGASVAQGLAHVSSLAAIAAEVLDSTGEEGVLVAQDARMSEVYLGVYRRMGAGKVICIGDETIESVGPLPVTADGWLAAGSAWERYPELLAANRMKISAVTGVHYPRAGFLLRLADAGNGVPPEQLMPAYLRSKVAEKPE